MFVYSTNQKAAFLNKRGIADCCSKTDLDQAIKPQEPESEVSFARNSIGQLETNENRGFERVVSRIDHSR